MLETLTVYVLAIESPGIYSRQTIDIYSDSRRTIWHFAEAKLSTPHVLQKRCWIALLLKRYSVSALSPDFNSKFSSGVNASTKPIRWQREQLHVIVFFRSTSTS